MRRISIIMLLAVGLCSCSDSRNESKTTTTDTTASEVQTEPAGADAVAGKSVLTGSLAGYYVENFAGANTHSYEFKFRNGAYTGIYEEHQDGEHKKVFLKDVIGDETTKTLTFDQDGMRLTGTVTAAGFELGEEIFGRRDETK